MPWRKFKSKFVNRKENSIQDKATKKAILKWH